MNFKEGDGMKRVFSGILTLVILLGMMSMAALAEDYDFNDQQQKLEPNI